MTPAQIINRTRTLIALFALRPGQWIYLRELKQSGLFDRQFYLKANPSLHPFVQKFAERHFILFGEQAGLYPCPDFSPAAYLKLNPDLSVSKVAPFHHFIRHGQFENRPSAFPPAKRDSLTVPLPDLTPRTPGHAIAVLCHMYYEELWDEFSTRLSSIDTGFDLFVSITHHGEVSTALKGRIEAEWPGSTVVLMPNHGRDVFPFVHMVNSRLFEGYAALCKLHTKISPHRADGHKWRRSLIEGILPPEGTSELVGPFIADPKAGILVADGARYSGAKWWGVNFKPTQELLARSDIEIEEESLEFPAGSIYWIKPEVLEMISNLHLDEEHFEAEQGQTDGTVAHAFERAIGYLVRSADLEIREPKDYAVSNG
ncbi:MAG: rhamnan synthesis F family protein [Pseudomonadota bacterium]